ncbi:uncharacterized protein LOC131957868 isoform X2 [Physella acuta]|nr:uncharacterized protein LOC131957868 isoform X2 [Physella acuta]
MDKRRRASSDTGSSADETHKSSSPLQVPKKLKLQASGKSKVNVSSDSPAAKANDEKKDEVPNKDALTSEMRRLKTTDGFIYGSRSSSPAAASEQGDAQKSGNLSRRGSRTSTPDVSPASARVKSKIQKKPVENGETLSRSSTPVSELRRLKTTEGFWSQSVLPLGPRTGSRDGSPSSTSSLDMLTKQGAKSQKLRAGKLSVKKSSPVYAERKARSLERKKAQHSPATSRNSSADVSPSPSSSLDRSVYELSLDSSLTQATTMDIDNTDQEIKKPTRGRPKKKKLMLTVETQTCDGVEPDESTSQMDESADVSAVEANRTELWLSMDWDESESPSNVKKHRGRPRTKNIVYDKETQTPPLMKVVGSGSLHTLTPETGQCISSPRVTETAQKPSPDVIIKPKRKYQRKDAQATENKKTKKVISRGIKAFEKLSKQKLFKKVKRKGKVVEILRAGKLVKKPRKKKVKSADGETTPADTDQASLEDLSNPPQLEMFGETSKEPKKVMKKPRKILVDGVSRPKKAGLPKLKKIRKKIRDNALEADLSDQVSHENFSDLQQLGMLGESLKQKKKVVKIRKKLAVDGVSRPRKTDLPKLKKIRKKINIDSVEMDPSVTDQLHENFSNMPELDMASKPLKLKKKVVKIRKKLALDGINRPRKKGLVKVEKKRKKMEGGAYEAQSAITDLTENVINQSNSDAMDDPIKLKEKVVKRRKKLAVDSISRQRKKGLAKMEKDGIPIKKRLLKKQLGDGSMVLKKVRKKKLESSEDGASQPLKKRRKKSVIDSKAVSESAALPADVGLASSENKEEIKETKAENSIAESEAQPTVHKEKRKSKVKYELQEIPQEKPESGALLFKTSELRRLNTTAGFWSPAPGLDEVLSTSKPKRSLHVKRSPKRQESSLLQHRIRKLHSLHKNSLRKGKLASENIVESVTVLPSGNVVVPLGAAVELKRRNNKLLNLKNEWKITDKNTSATLQPGSVEGSAISSGHVSSPFDFVSETFGDTVSQTFATSTPVAQSAAPKKTWQRGRRKQIGGEPRPKPSPGRSAVETRHKKKKDDLLSQSMEVVSMLERETSQKDECQMEAVNMDECQGKDLVPSAPQVKSEVLCSQGVVVAKPDGDGSQGLIVSKPDGSSKMLSSAELEASQVLTAAKLDDATEHLTVAKLDDATEHLTAAKLNDATEQLTKLDDATEHMTVAKLDDATQHLTATKLDDATEHLTSTKLDDVTQQLTLPKPNGVAQVSTTEKLDQTSSLSTSSEPAVTDNLTSAEVDIPHSSPLVELDVQQSVAPTPVVELSEGSPETISPPQPITSQTEAVEHSHQSITPSLEPITCQTEAVEHSHQSITPSLEHTPPVDEGLPPMTSIPETVRDQEIVHSSHLETVTHSVEQISLANTAAHSAEQISLAHPEKQTTHSEEQTSLSHPEEQTYVADTCVSKEGSISTVPTKTVEGVHIDEQNATENSTSLQVSTSNIDGSAVAEAPPAPGCETSLATPTDAGDITEATSPTEQLSSSAVLDTETNQAENQSSHAENVAHATSSKTELAGELLPHSPGPVNLSDALAMLDMKDPANKGKKKRKRMIFTHKKQKRIYRRSKLELPAPLVTADGLEESSAGGVMETLADGLVESPLKSDPLRRVKKKRRRNTWKKGVVKKPAHVVKKKKMLSLLNVGQPETEESVSVADEKLETAPTGPESQEVVEKKPYRLKSAKEKTMKMLKRLHTNANLANAVMDENIFRGRFLRTLPQKPTIEKKPRRKRIVKQQEAMIPNLCDDTMPQLTVDIPPETSLLKKRRGRPRKLSTGSLPKLTPTDIDSPLYDSNTSWDKAPPRLSPQIDTSKSLDLLLDAENKSQPDSEFVAESVDDTDFHLYLSGVSDEDFSSTPKDSVFSSDKRSSPPLALSNLEVPCLINELLHEASPAGVVKKSGRRKMKGRRGRPPGLPMTEEEKLRKSNKRLVYSARSIDSSATRFEVFNFIKRPRTARKSMQRSKPRSPSASASNTEDSSSKVSLRKKSTRSPLEMLEMKRRQEEAIYDLEEEKRQARRILLREKRFARESGDGFSEEMYVELTDGPIKECTVVLTDFVKKLQLDNIVSTSDNEEPDEEVWNKSISPRVGLHEAEEQEDWENVADGKESEEWRVNENPENRPYIPRLKLKRVMKKSQASPSRQEPIKLVIKTESMGDSSGKVSHVDISKVDRTGFEGSFLDFLKDRKTDHPAHKKSYRSKSVPRESSKVGALIDSRVRKATVQHSFSGFSIPPATPPSSGCVSPSRTISSPLKVHTPEKGGMNSSTTPSGTPRTVPLPDEEDEDMLILDLDESAPDQNSSDSLKDSSLADTPGKSRPAGTTSISQLATDDTLPPPLVQRIPSNDEMGLMLDSYNTDGASHGQSSNAAEKPEDGVCTELEAATDLTVGKTDLSKEKPIDDIPVPTTDSPMDSHVEETSISPSESVSDSTPNEDSLIISNTRGKSSPENRSPRQSKEKCQDWKVKVVQQSDKVASGKYMCKLCDFSTSARLMIESHIYTHMPGVQFRCSYCLSEFSAMSATYAHLKNTHSPNEAKLHISKHIEEKNFYEKEDLVISEPPAPQAVHPGGQSPPVIISVVVSGPVGAGRCARAPARRFVCTHCGFSTNVKEDVEHHISDLHRSSTLYACILCNENIFYSESDIKQHSTTVHPSRPRPYRKLPDFYDAEQLSSKGKSPSQDDQRENIFERMTTIFQTDDSQQDTGTIDHHQKAKEYLYLQEEWREKTRVEADSTTAVDFTEQNHETTMEPEDMSSKNDDLENEASSGDDGKEVLGEDVGKVPSKDVSHDEAITSSAVPPALAEDTGADTPVTDLLPADDHSQQSFSPPVPEKSAVVTELSSTVEGSQDNSGPAEDNMGLKIVDVVSLSSEQEEPVPLDESGVLDLSKSVKRAVERVSPQQTPALPEEIIDDQQPTDLSMSKKSSDSAASVPSEPKDLATSSTPASSNAESASAVSSASKTSSAINYGLPLSYKCNACKVHTPYLLMMVKHLKAKHPSMRCFACPYCKTIHSFISQKQLRLHVKHSHPDKIGRNEIALSEEAKKFVEAMVLPSSPECIKVGNRVVLEEDIHTCTYCQVKMTSLGNVYEHLNSKHSDLFEFVCPNCQVYKSKVLADISLHCVHVHKVRLDTDKVHVSVPKNLFAVLTCISKGGKYIEKNIGATEDGAPKQTDAAAPPAVESPAPVQTPQPAHQNPEPLALDKPAAKAPLMPAISPRPMPMFPTPVVSQPIPLIAIPLMAAPVGSIPVVTSRSIPISSSLFDTSSMTAPPPLIPAAAAAKPAIKPTAGASSFLCHGSQQVPALASKQPAPKHSKSSTNPKTVLNIPSVKPRAATGDPSLYPNIVTSLGSSPLHHLSASPATPSPGIDNIPESEPAPDAFKIFNLRPTTPASTAPPPPNAIVFPPVSTPQVTSFIQGPMAGFPSSMVIPHTMLMPFSYTPPLMMSQKQTTQSSSSTPRHVRQIHPALSSSAPPPQSARFIQDKALSYLKKQHQQQYQKGQIDQQWLKQQQLMVQQKSTQPATTQPQHASHFQSAPSHNVDHRPSETPARPTSASPQAGSAIRPSKGIHKRSSSMYQCPYCPTVVTLRALDVASHIQQYHPGCQVTFKKAHS